MSSQHFEASRETAIRRAVDDFFISVGSLIAAQIADENAKLADLFRKTRDSGVAFYGRPFVQRAMTRLVNTLIGDNWQCPLWVGILLTGRLNSRPHVAKRFIYWDHTSGTDKLCSAAALWDKLIDADSALKKHFDEKLSLSKWYETGLLEPAIRQVHLLNVDCGPNLSSLGKINPRTTAIGLFGSGAAKLSGMYHGLEEQSQPKFDRYLEFIFGGSSGISLYTATPIVSEHNVMKRSIGEVFLAEGVQPLDADARGDLLTGLRLVALGLSARFFFIDQEELEEERSRLKKFEERLTLIEKPLRSMAHAIDQVRADTQRINMAVYEPSDNLFKHHRELSPCFTQQMLQLSERLSLQVAHTPKTYTDAGHHTSDAAGVLFLALGIVLGFDKDLRHCQAHDELIAAARARLTFIYGQTGVQKRTLQFIMTHVLNVHGLSEIVNVQQSVAIAMLEALKAIVHTPFKPDADEWPILPLIVSSLSETSETAPPVAFEAYANKELCVSAHSSKDARKQTFDQVRKLSPLAWHQLLEFVSLLRDSQMQKAGETPVTGLSAISHKDEHGNCRDRLIVVTIKLRIRSIDNRATDVAGYVSGVKEAIDERMKGSTTGNPNERVGEATWPYLYFLEAGSAWRYLRPSVVPDVSTLATCLTHCNGLVPKGGLPVDQPAVVFCLVPCAHTTDVLNCMICACRVGDDETTARIDVYFCRKESL